MEGTRCQHENLCMGVVAERDEMLLNRSHPLMHLRSMCVPSVSNIIDYTGRRTTGRRCEQITNPQKSMETLYMNPPWRTAITPPYFKLRA